MQVTRQRRASAGPLSGSSADAPAAGSASSRPAPPLSPSPAAGIAYASTDVFGTDQVGQSHRPGPGRLRRPVHQARSATASSSTTARSCRPRSARTAPTSRPRVTDGGVALADRRPEDLEGAAARRQRRGGRTCSISGNERGPGRPHVLARRHAAVAGPDRRLHQVHRERRRHPRRPDVRHDPGGRRQARAGGQGGVLRRRLHRVRPRSTARTGWSPSTRRPAPSSRAGPWATPRATWSLVGTKLYVSNEGGRPAKPGDTTINSYGTQVPADPKTGATTTGTVSVIDLADPAAAVGEHRRRPAPDRAVRQERGACSSPTPPTTTCRSSTPPATRSSRPSPPSRGRRRRSATSPTAVTLTDDGHLLVTLGRANAVAVYRYTQPAGAGQLRRPAPDGLLPGGDHHRRRRRSWSPTPAASTPRPGHRSRQCRRTAPTTPRRACRASRCRATARSPGTPPTGLPAERLDAGSTSSRRTAARRAAGAGPDAARRPVDDQARLPDRQGEPHLRPGLRRRSRRATATRRWPSSART